MRKWLIVTLVIVWFLVVVCTGSLLQDAHGPTESTTVPTTQSTAPSTNTQPTSPSEDPIETTVPPESTVPPTQPVWATIPDGRTLTASQYFVYDLSAGSYLTISGSQTEQVYPASITKLYSAYLALQYLDADDVVTVGNELNMVAAGSSVANLKKGVTLSVGRLVEGMLLPSGNDASYVLAAAAGRAIAGDPNMGYQNAVNLFIEHMNDQCSALGLTGSHWINPDGIHKENHYTTFQDLVTITRVVLENDIIMGYAATAKDDVAFPGSDEIYEWKNTNALIDPESEFYCSYAIGLKTGQTPKAGACLLSAFEVEGRQIVIGVFNCASSDDRFLDTLQLLGDAVGN